MPLKRLSLLIVLLIALVFVLPALANVNIDFEGYTNGTPATDLAYPGVTFTDTNWFILTAGPLPTHHLLGPCGTGLTINFDTPQTSGSFNWASINDQLVVEVLLGGSPVSTENFAGPFGSLATINATFDQLIIDAGDLSGCAAIDNLSTTSAVAVGGGIQPFTDGRINREDLAAPVVLYANNGGLDIYSATGSGLLFSVSAAEIEAVGCPSENTVIASEGGITLSRLARTTEGNCPFQLNAPTATPGKQYVIIFESISSTSDYTSYEQ